MAYSYGRPAESYIAQNKAESKKNKKTTNHSTTKSNPVSLPIIGDAKDVQEAITGKDFVTGKKLSKTHHVITAAASVIPVVSGKSC